MTYWLLKSEPDAWSWDQQKREGPKGAEWDGVRNYQARNMMRDEMKTGDKVFFYHSACEQPGIVGIAKVAGKSYPDPTAFDPKDKHFDAKSDPDDPRWFLVDVKYVRKLKRTIGLSELKEHDALSEMVLVRRGNRLSIMPVSKSDWDYILDLE